MEGLNRGKMKTNWRLNGGNMEEKWRKNGGKIEAHWKLVYFRLTMVANGGLWRQMKAHLTTADRIPTNTWHMRVGLTVRYSAMGLGLTVRYSAMALGLTVHNSAMGDGVNSALQCDGGWD